MSATKVTFADKTQTAAYDAAKLNADDVNALKKATNDNATILDKLNDTSIASLVDDPNTVWDFRTGNRKSWTPAIDDRILTVTNWPEGEALILKLIGGKRIVFAQGTKSSPFEFPSDGYAIISGIKMYGEISWTIAAFGSLVPAPVTTLVPVTWSKMQSGVTADPDGTLHNNSLATGGGSDTQIFGGNYKGAQFRIPNNIGDCEGGVLSGGDDSTPNDTDYDWNFRYNNNPSLYVSAGILRATDKNGGEVVICSVSAGDIIRWYFAESINGGAADSARFFKSIDGGITFSNAGFTTSQIEHYMAGFTDKKLVGSWANPGPFKIISEVKRIIIT